MLKSKSSSPVEVEAKIQQVLALPEIPKQTLHVKPKEKPKITRAPSVEEIETLDIHFRTTCIFCGYTDSTFDCEKLDEHYWEDCVMIMHCESCNQVLF